uniref:Uncharacterized protein n=1 Tax=Rousettus aegyptiacus TaxID=9407 RepID=A0A7J8BA84_ROUAE|nr:hypothetical protein HJG63_009946 [Rousettus aegyptiacus]
MSATTHTDPSLNLSPLVLPRNTPREIFLEPPHSTDRRGGLEVRAGFISQPGPGTRDCLFAFRQTFCVPSPPVQTADPSRTACGLPPLPTLRRPAREPSRSEKPQGPSEVTRGSTSLHCLHLQGLPLAPSRSQSPHKGPGDSSARPVLPVPMQTTYTHCPTPPPATRSDGARETWAGQWRA